MGIELTPVNDAGIIDSKKDVIKKNKTIIIIGLIIIIIITILLYSFNQKLGDVLLENEQLKNRVELLYTMNYTDSLQHRIAGGVVTDHFVVQKFTLTAIPKIGDGNGFLSTTIDLATQSGGDAGHIGRGKFSIEDRELKGMIIDILNGVRSYSSGFESFDIPHWDKGTHVVTILNFEIGTYENGEFKLKGE